MRVLRALVLALSFLTPYAFADKHEYQSDVARLRKIVVNSLYSHRDVFLRELISNANDALEKLRLTSLTQPVALEGAQHLNISIRAYPADDVHPSPRLVITDTGIGMTPEELTANLGTLAKSGTSEFLNKAESDDATGQGNLIGAFGLGFYSSFLVAEKVVVKSIPAKSKSVPNPVQHVFTSSAEESAFEVYPDPEGNTLGRGTELTLILKDDSKEYLETHKLQELVNKHSAFSSSFPLYLYTERTEEVPIEEETSPASAESTSEAEPTPAPRSEDDEDEEALIEDVDESGEETSEEEQAPKTRSVLVPEWIQLNPQPPVWTRDPKDVGSEEYTLTYQALFKDHNAPLAWSHFTGDLGSGASFKALVYIPSHLGDKYWQNPLESEARDVKLLVKRVFITNSLVPTNQQGQGVDSLPKWATWAKVVIDADDLPLNVSRENLQSALSSRILAQLRSTVLKRIVQLLQKLDKDAKEALLVERGEDGELPEEAKAKVDKYKELVKVYGNVFKLGAVEDHKNREKLAGLVRFKSNLRGEVGLDSYLEGRKKGQKQIFYLADMGKRPEDLAKSVFVEKLHARGYEVLLLTEPLDEIFIQNLRKWKGTTFQDVAKAGLKFGDEEEDPEEEKAKQAALTEEYQPLLDWLKTETNGIVRNVVISNRLVTSPCAIVADTYGYTANVERMMSAQQAKSGNPALHDMARKMKILEVNPRSPLIEGLLRRVKQLPGWPPRLPKAAKTEEERKAEEEKAKEEGREYILEMEEVEDEVEERDLEAEEELREAASVLIDGALVRSGFEVPDSNEFFTRMDRILRRSLGVSETAPTDATVKPAPPQMDPEEVAEELKDDKPETDDENDDEDDAIKRFEDTHVKIDAEMLNEIDPGALEGLMKPMEIPDEKAKVHDEL